MDDLAWLMARQRFGIRPGLGRVRALLARLGRPERTFGAVLVGGTNGKGSTASALSSMVLADARRVGLFTSPHLSFFSERFLMQGEPLPAQAIDSALARVKPEAEALEATFFEILVALACLLFTEAGVELAVMEVGLGGRYDATNALSPLLSVVTGVALDHSEVLGDTVEAIARDKAQIFRAGRPALTGATGVALGVVRAEAARIGAELSVLGEDATLTLEASGWDGLRLSVGVGDECIPLQTPLIGSHQARNVALAAAAALRLGASVQAVQQGAAETRWPGRLELLPFRGRRVLLDGAHNLEAAQALTRALQDLGAAPDALLLGLSEGKDARGILGALAPTARALVLTRARLSPRSAEPDGLRALLPDPGPPAEVVPDPEAALARALELSPEGGLVLVAGSLYLVGELRPVLLGRSPEGWERWQ